MRECDKCAGTIQAGAKFCPHCGDPVTEADKPLNAVATSEGAEALISFGRSTSASYDQAVSICKNIPSYSEQGEGKTLQHSVSLPLTELELIINIWELVGSWKSSKLLIGGQPASKKDLVYKGLGCFRQRQKAYNPSQYCFGEREFETNIWGCKQLNMGLYRWGGGWLEHGHIDKSGVWHVDKDKIRHELEQRMAEVALCPVLDRARVLETLERFPEQIDPRKSPGWEYVTNYEQVRGKYRDVAVGVRPVLKQASRYVVGDYRPDWEYEDDAEDDSDDERTTTYRITVDTSSPSKAKKSSGSGCMLTLVLVLAIVASLVGAALIG